MLFNFNYDIPDGSIYFDEMPTAYQDECRDMFIVGSEGLLGNDPQVQMTGDVGWIMVFGGYKLKVDKRVAGFHLAGL